MLQKDAAWRDQHGGPADPQPGNIGGTRRDVLRSADFTNGNTQGFNAQAGTGSVVNNRYQSAPLTSSGDAIGLFDQSDTVIPTYFEVQASINAVKATGGLKAHAYLIFDWQSDTNFKFAGIDISTNKQEIGRRTASGWVVDRSTNVLVKADTDYVIMLKVNGSTATALIGNTSVSFTFAARIDARGVQHGLNAGIVGVGGRDAKTQIDNVVVQKAPEPITVDVIADFSAASPASRLFNSAVGRTGTWAGGSGGDNRYTATTTDANIAAINLASVGSLPITPGSLLSIETTLKTSGMGGVVFDYHGPNYYKYVVLSADAKQILIGHRSGNTWTTDPSVALNVNTSTDYKLGVSLRGGLVNVSINGGVVVSKIYTETVTDGGYGLISLRGATSGVTSFDIIRISSDEGGYAPPAALLQTTANVNRVAASDAIVLPSDDVLASLVDEARRRWAGAGLDALALERLAAVTVQFADLPGAALGQEVDGVVYIDLDAAGQGWFVDPTPGDDAEFGTSPAQQKSPRADVAGRIDLLSVIAHEMGHAAGLDHDAGGVMAERLDPGVRSLPAAATIAAVNPATRVTVAAAVTPARSLGMQPSSTGWAPAAADGARRLPTVDWSAPVRPPADTAVSRKATGPGVATPSSAASWQRDFVNHLGRTEGQRNPNAALRLQIDLASRVSASLSKMESV